MAVRLLDRSSGPRLSIRCLRLLLAFAAGRVLRQSRTMSARTLASTHIQLLDADRQWAFPTLKNDVAEAALPMKEEHGAEGKDPNLVGWEEGEKENPRNWSTAYKSWLTFQLGMLALAASMGSSIIAPAERTIAKYTGVSSEVAVLSISLYM